MIPGKSRLARYFLFPLLFAAALAGSSAWAASEVNLLLKVKTFRSQQGNLMVAIYDDARAFPDHPEGAAKLVQEKITGDTMEVKVAGLHAGTYAVSLFHDENGNGQLDKGSFGIPKEGFGFSRNPAIRYSAPAFDDVKVELVPGENTLEIKLNYM